MLIQIKLNRWNDVLVAILKARSSTSYCEKLYKKLKCSRTYIRRVVASLHKSNLIRRIPQGKITQLELTERGKRIAELAMAIKSELLYSSGER